MSAPVCPDCGHQHRGPEWAGICVGCPCQTSRPGSEVGLSAGQVTYLLRCLAVDPGGRSEYLDGWRDGMAHALELVNDLLTERTTSAQGDTAAAGV